MSPLSQLRQVQEAREAISSYIESNSAACVSCSFQAGGMVLLHLLREQRPDIPVLFVDTGYHFAEVYRYRDEMAARYGLNLVNVMPAQSVPQQESDFGILYESQPDRCCRMRKVEPLFSALKDYDLWFTGLRRAQSSSRANLQVEDHFLLPSGKRLLKISPLARWSEQDVWSYAREHDIPLLPLYDDGYTSIGCQPCTSLPVDPENARSGRWAGRKLECGIHIAEAS